MMHFGAHWSSCGLRGNKEGNVQSNGPRGNGCVMHFFDLVQACLFGRDGKKQELDLYLILYLVLKALCCVTDVGGRIEITKAQMFERLISA